MRPGGGLYFFRIEPERIGFEVGFPEAVCDIEDMPQFSRAVNLRMARGNLLNEGRARARHANDKYRNFRRVAPTGSFPEELGGKHLDDRLDLIFNQLGIINLALAWRCCLSIELPVA